MPRPTPNDPQTDEAADWHRRVVGRSLRTARGAVGRPGLHPHPGGRDGPRPVERRGHHGAGGGRRGRAVPPHPLPVLREQGRPPPGGVRGGDAHLCADDPQRDRRPHRPDGAAGRGDDRRGAHARVQRHRRRPGPGAAAAQALRGRAPAGGPGAGGGGHHGPRAGRGGRGRGPHRGARPRGGDLHAAVAQRRVHHVGAAGQRHGRQPARRGRGDVVLPAGPRRQARRGLVRLDRGPAAVPGPPPGRPASASKRPAKRKARA